MKVTNQAQKSNEAEPVVEEVVEPVTEAAVTEDLPVVDEPELPEAEVVEPALNEDGLVAGQEISFYDLLRIKSEQRNKEAE
jgi:hypothetical protein